MVNSELSQQAIIHASTRIDPVFLNSPQFELDALKDALNTRIVLKVETLNPIRSFKGRGADYFVTQHVHKPSFVCASAGNFGQGMAYACRKHRIPLTVYAAKTANPLKLARMRQLGAEVKLVGIDFDAAKEAGKAYALAENRTFVEDGCNVEIAIGAGTLGLELSRYPEPIDTLLIPLGNGSLINGIGAWFKAHSPQTRIIGVVAAGAPAMDLSWRQGHSVATATVNTISDGIAVRNPVPEALQIMKATVDDIVQVTDDATLEAMKLTQKLVGIVLEPAGAVGLAAVMSDRDRFAKRLIAIPLCGSNLAEELLEQ